MTPETTDAAIRDFIKQIRTRLDEAAAVARAADRASMPAVRRKP